MKSLNTPLFWIPAAVFLVQIIHGSLLGMTDDEAYYWVLAQKPAWGYAYHPPAVAWVIGFFEWLLTPLKGILLTSSGIVRFPAALITALCVALAMRWMRSAGAPEGKLVGATFVLLGFAGMFGASWMMVPDLPLVLGWFGIFIFTWNLCFGKASNWVYAGLVLSTAWAMASKLPAVFSISSAALCLLIWAPARIKWRGLAAVISGSVLGLLPFLIFNLQNDWGPILYHLRERHSGSEFSWVRWSQFWVIILVAAGPPLLLYFFMLFKRTVWGTGGGSVYDRVTRYLFCWVLPPALVFCVQPAFSPFKPHWALMVWLPVALLLAFSYAKGRDIRLARFQRAYGLGLMGVVIFACHFPIVSVLIHRMTLKPPDPRWDVSNDMYGWSGLPEFIKEVGGADAEGLPVLGSRYQTAANAAFALGRPTEVARVPRSPKEFAEWPEISAIHESDQPGPDWPRLKSSVLYVSDVRFREPPRYPSAQCRKLGRYQAARWKYLAKWIDVWRCDPPAALPITSNASGIPQRPSC